MTGDEVIGVRAQSPSNGTQKNDSDNHADSTCSTIGSSDDNAKCRDGCAPGDADSLTQHELPSSLKRWVKVVLSRLPGDGQVHIYLRDDASIWAMGDANADIVGVSIETAARSTVLKLNNFSINKRELHFSTYAPCDEVRMEICVCCIGDTICGQVDLPLGASVTFQSIVDRTTLMGFSSFALNFSV
jgi:hypothetical protein